MSDAGRYLTGIRQSLRSERQCGKQSARQRGSQRRSRRRGVAIRRRLKSAGREVQGVGVAAGIPRQTARRSAVDHGRGARGQAVRVRSAQRGSQSGSDLRQRDLESQRPPATSVGREELFFREAKTVAASFQLAGRHARLDSQLTATPLTTSWKLVATEAWRPHLGNGPPRQSLAPHAA